MKYDAREKLTDSNERPGMVSIGALLTQGRPWFWECTSRGVDSSEHCGQSISGWDKVIGGDKLGRDNDSHVTLRHRTCNPETSIVLPSYQTPHLERKAAIQIGATHILWERTEHGDPCLAEQYWSVPYKHQRTRLNGDRISKSVFATIDFVDQYF